MKFHPRSTFTKDLKGFIFIPLLILLVFTITNDSNYLLLLLPVLVLLILLHNNIQNFQEMQDYIEIHRTYSSTRVSELNDLIVNLIIKNTSDFDIKMIQLIDDIPGVFELHEGSNTFLFNLKKHEEVSLSYKVISSEIGIYEFNSVTITIYETFGSILETFEIFPQPIKITVSPQIEKFDAIPIFTYWMKYFNGYFVSKEAGEDNDFLGVREYTYGDNTRRINWKATSKYSSTGFINLYSNTFDREKAMDVELVIDFSYESLPVYAEGLRAIGSLTEFLLRTRNKVGLTIAKQDPEHYKSKMSQKHLRTVIDLLLQTVPDFKRNSGLMAERLLVLSKLYRKRSVVIVVSPLVNEVFIKYCEKMKQNGFTIIIIKLNTLQKQLFQAGSGDFEELYPLKVPLFFNVIAFDFLVKNFVIKNRMLTLSIPMFTWDTQMPLNTVMKSRRR